MSFGLIHICFVLSVFFIFFCTCSPRKRSVFQRINACNIEFSRRSSLPTSPLDISITFWSLSRCTDYTDFFLFLYAKAASVRTSFDIYAFFHPPITSRQCAFLVPVISFSFVQVYLFFHIWFYFKVRQKEARELTRGPPNLRISYLHYMIFCWMSDQD